MLDEQLYGVATVASLYERAIRRYADREAIVSGDTRYTYRQFGEEISRYVQMFKSYGLKRGDALALLSGNRPEVMFVMAACQFMGMRYTPLHPLGSVEDHVFVLEDAEICALVVDGCAYPDQARALPSLRMVLTFEACGFGHDLSERVAQFRPQPLQIDAVGSDIAQVFYTGGTTGRSKGVAMPHRMWVNNMKGLAAEREFPLPLRFLMASPISHAGGGNIAPIQLKGGAIVIQPKFDPLSFLQMVERERITATILVPTALYSVLDHPRLKEFDVSSLKLIVYGSAPIAPTRLEQAMEVFGPIFCQLYGQTECGSISYLALADHSLDKAHLLESCGLPVMGIDVRILDQDLREVQVGEIGEICVRGPSIMAGYWKRPEETAKVFEGGWLHTGDLAKRDADGYLYIVGRAKDMIISGGFNVYPKEIEDVIGEHPAVALCAVIGVPHPKWGEAVTAFVVAKAGASARPDELIAMVKDRKGAVHAPKTVYFVESLPLTGYHKVDKVALRKPFWEEQARQVG